MARAILHERGTHPGHVRSGSAYVALTTHPAVAAAAASGTAALVGAGLHARRQARRAGPLRRLLGVVGP